MIGLGILRKILQKWTKYCDLKSINKLLLEKSFVCCAA